MEQNTQGGELCGERRPVPLRWRNRLYSTLKYLKKHKSI